MPTPQRRPLRRIAAWLLAALLVGAALWALWPIYGFVSNQYEVARSPFGWADLPEEVPTTQAVRDSQYAAAGAAALRALVQRRKETAAPSLSGAGVVGWQDVERAVAATPETAYRIGSTSKAVTATVLARLVADGRIDLDAPLSVYVQDLPNEAWGPMTARQLASHTAGLPNYEENTDWTGFYHTLALQRHYGTSSDALGVFDGSRLLHEPGAGFHYTSLGTVLLAVAIEQAAGAPFEAALDREVSVPLGLQSLGPDRPGGPSDPVAVSYQRRGGGFKPWRPVDLSSKTAAGGLAASPTDLARLGAAWLDDEFVPPAIRDEFWTPGRLSDGAVNEQDYALGWRRKSWDIPGVGPVVHLNHGGVSKGSQAWLMVAPEHGASVALATNARTAAFFDFADVYVDVLAAFLPVETGPPTTGR